MKRTWLAAAVIAISGLATTAWAQDEYVLQSKYPKPGEPVVIRTHGHIVGSFYGMGFGTQKITQKLQQWMKLECLEVDGDGVARIRLTFERMAIDMDFAGSHVSFDSAEPPSTQPDKEDPAKEAMRRGAGLMFTGKGITMTVTPEGKCLKIEGLDELLASMKDIPGGEQMAQSLKESMSDNALSSQYLNSHWLPKKPVRVGEVWSSEQRMKMGPLGDMVAKTRNRLLGVETIDGRRIARVAQTMNMELSREPGAPKWLDMENVQVKVTSLGGTGEWLWDLDKGRAVGGRQNAPMELSAEFGSTTQPSLSVKTGVKADYTTVIEVVGDPIAAKLLTAETPKAPVQEPGKAATETSTPATQPAAVKQQ